MKPDQILEDMWGLSGDKHVFMPTMKDGVWTEGPALESATAAQEYSLEYNTDLYFTPHTFITPQRRKAFVHNPTVIYADLDGGHIEEPRLAPNLIVSTSNGHYHAYWYLSESAPPSEWEARAKGWSAELGADPGGWDITQVLRVPNTLNWKTDPPKKVYVQKYDPTLRYDLEQFPAATIISIGDPEDSTPDRNTGYATDILNSQWGTIPLSARYWLTVTPEDMQQLGTIDRSKVMWGIERALISAGFTPYATYQLVLHSAVNKWSGRDDMLWREVKKAAAAE